MVFSEPATGTVLFNTDVMDGQGGPQTIVASHPAEFSVALDTNRNVKHPEGELAVYEGIILVP